MTEELPEFLEHLLLNENARYADYLRAHLRARGTIDQRTKREPPSASSKRNALMPL